MLTHLLMENRGVVARQQLLALGLTPLRIQELCANETLDRLRRGWYADPRFADATVRRAVHAGGVLSCVSALKLHGLWTPPDAHLHIRRSRRLRRTLLPAGTRQCRPWGSDPAITVSVDPVLIGLACAINCVVADDAVVLLDSALNSTKASEADLATIFADLPHSKSKLLSLIDPTAQSGTETYVRLRLRRRGIKVRSQVQIPGVGRVDFLVGDRLVLEVDGFEHHSSFDNYTNDRQRDRVLVGLGYLVVRLRYQDVLHGWDAVEPDLLAIIRRGGHRWPRRQAAQPTGAANWD